MQVSEVMSRNVAVCPETASLADVARLMLENDCGAIPIVSNGAKKPVGIITDRDIVCRSLALGKSPSEMKAGECMTTPCVTVSPDTDFDSCRTLMEDKQVRRVLVVNGDGSCSGIVAQADIASHASKRASGELLREVSKPSAMSMSEHRAGKHGKASVSAEAGRGKTGSFGRKLLGVAALVAAGMALRSASRSRTTNSVAGLLPRSFQRSVRKTWESLPRETQKALRRVPADRLARLLH